MNRWEAVADPWLGASPYQRRQDNAINLGDTLRLSGDMFWHGHGDRGQISRAEPLVSSIQEEEQ
jgi:N-dimethylarginine dimethylaminohydrolase